MYFPFQVVRRLRTEFARAVAAVAKARADLRAALEIYHDAKYRRMAFDWTYDVSDSGSSTWEEEQEEKQQEEEGEELQEESEEDEDEHLEEEAEEEEKENDESGKQ